MHIDNDREEDKIESQTKMIRTLVNRHEFEILKSLLRVPILPIPSFVIF